MKRVVITGPTGAIGIALVKKCVSEGTEVLAICRKGSGRIVNIPKDAMVTILEADLNELKNLDAPDKKSYDVFYHFAWNGTFGESRNDMSLQIDNICCTLDAVCLAARLGCHTFVGAGSQAEYGRVSGMLSPDTPAYPENGYGMAKLCAGQMSRHECQKAGMKHIWTRILSVYGPGDGKDTMIMSALRKMLRGESTSFTKGGQMWDYLYSSDAAQAMYLLGEKGISGRVYCVGSGQARPLREYIEIMHRIAGGSVPPGFGDVPYGEKQVMYLCADIRQLSEDTGFTPQTLFEDGIRRTIRWMKVNEEDKCVNSVL